MPGSSSRPHSPITDTNLNTSWVHNPGFRYMYVFLLVSGWVFFRMLFFSEAAHASTALLQLHAFLTFILLHWLKGTPEMEQQQYDPGVQKMTFWEQIDVGYMGTPTRRFLCAVPILLFFATLVFNAAHDDMVTLGVNVAATLLCVVPKHEALFGVRLFGVNAD